MNLLLLFFLVYWIQLSFVVYCSNDDEDYPLPVLVLVPYPDPRIESGWDRGLELIPAARVAVKEINNRTDLLPGYKIQLIEASSDACSVIITSTGMTNFASYALSTTRTNAIAVTGLVCSSVTAAISQVAGRSEIDLLQIAMAYSPIFNDQNLYRRIWRVLPSSLSYINAMIALMNHFNWNKVSTLYDEQGVYYQTTAEIFREEITKSTGNHVFLHLGIDDSDIFIDHALDQIANEAARIIFVSTTIPQAGILMCKVFNRNLIWPGFMWILQAMVQAEIIATKACDLDTLNKALENVVFLNFPLENRHPDDILVSGESYYEYRKKYFEELQSFQREDQVKKYLSYFKFEPYGNDYSNPMYDEIWALALALNSSLPDLESYNLSLKNYQYNMSEITDIIERHLKNVSFSGTLGDIRFDANHSSLVPVFIHQIRNGYPVQIGDYKIENDNLTLWNISEIKFPGDDFDIRYNHISDPVAIYLYFEACLCFLFTTLTLVVMLCLYKSPEIRATSPLLSILIFTGAYMNIAGSVVSIMRQRLVLSPLTYTILCNIDRRLSEYGLNIILATILIKLIRIFRVFTHFGATGKVWRDRYLFFIILAIATAIPIINNGISIGLSPLHYKAVEVFHNNENPPYKEIEAMCVSDHFHIFETVSALYTMFLLVCIVFFAYQTRKIEWRDFKDTKKVIVFVFACTLLLIGAMFPASRILHVLKEENVMVIMLSVVFHLSAVLPLMFLVAPKVFLIFYYRCTDKTATFSFSSSDTSQRRTYRSFSLIPSIPEFNVFRRTSKGFILTTFDPAMLDQPPKIIGVPSITIENLSTVSEESSSGTSV